MSHPNDANEPLRAAARERDRRSRLPESLTMNTRSMSSALRDLATLLAAGRGEYVVQALRDLADRVEEMAREQADG